MPEYTLVTRFSKAYLITYELPPNHIKKGEVTVKPYTTRHSRGLLSGIHL